MIEKKKVHPVIESIGRLYEFAMQQLGYPHGSISVENYKLRDIDSIDAYGTRRFSTDFNGEWVTLVEQID